MSGSAIMDGLLVAADALALDGVEAWDAALGEVERMGAWDFECWRATKRYGGGVADLTSLAAIYKAVYPPDGVFTMERRAGYKSLSLDNENFKIGMRYKHGLRMPTLRHVLFKLLEAL